MDGLILIPQSGEGRFRPGTTERREMDSSRHHRAETDGLAPAPQSGEGWDRPSTAERRWMVSS